MESPTKRPKISVEPDHVDIEINDDYSESYSEVEEDDFIVDDENDDVVYEPGYDPDQELQQRRAKLDYKLKSTFESIFEKYGKDFEGVGDEIDLLTGEILVDNGHLKEMQDERDAGDKKAGGNLLRALTVEPESVTETSGDEYSIEEEREVREEGNNICETTDDRDNVAKMSDGDMEEDDIILRGYDDPNQNAFVEVVATTELGAAQKHTPEDLQSQSSLQSEGKRVSFPSYNEILRSFGPKVAPQIVNIISRKEGQDDTHIEPAWRVPDLPVSEPRERPALRAFISEPEIERSPSPDMSESIWALPRGRGPRGPRGPRGSYKTRGPNSPRNLSDKMLHSDGLNTSDYTVSGSPRVRKVRATFTEEEDKILIAKVAEAHDQGLLFETDSIWKELESLGSRHSKISWKNRYRLKYMHLWSPEGSNRPGFLGPQGYYHRRNQEESESNIRSASRSPHPVSFFQRPSRTRRPVQHGSDVVSWSDAVATIKSLDPRLHKDLAKDASAYDLTDVRPVDVDEEALNLRSSDFELSNESDDEPELPARTSSGVQKIAPVAVNPFYEFSDEEAVPNHNGKPRSWLTTPHTRGAKIKPKHSNSRNGTSGKLRSRQSTVCKKLMSEDVDELSLGLDGEDALFICSLPRKDKQKKPQTSIKREDEQLPGLKAVSVPPFQKERMSALNDFDEFDELSVEWPPAALKAHPEPSILKPEDVPTAGPSNNAEETNIDLFDIDQLPETSPRSILDTRMKCRINKKFSSGAVIPSTSSQIESSPTVVVDARLQRRNKQRTSFVDNGPVPPTSSQTEGSPTPRPKRKFANLDEKENASFAPSHKTDQETETPVSDPGDMPLQNMINGNRTPSHKSFFFGGIITPTHNSAKKSRTPLLDYTTPTRRDLTKQMVPRDASHSPGMVKTPGGTVRKCGQDGFLCKRTFCFRCGLSSKRSEN